ncbi:zinc ribbon domain-containing protein, partial [Pseudomonas aeruginosa]|nr:zinc ribbon domain-containing protein [Pseudomonas aeruginosa]
GHTLATILQKLSKCKSGSKGFARAAAHRKTHINWLVKQLNLLNVKELKLENVENIKFGVCVSRLLKHWSNPLIRDSLIKLCEEQGVLVTLVANEYNSQRCNKCGWVQKSNRSGKLFHCKHCQHQDDADANA